MLFNWLNEHYDVRYTDRIAHATEHPVTNNWPELEKEMTLFFERNYSEPVIAVGHSLGGILSLRVAAKRPDLIKAVIVLDVPVLSRSEAFGLRLLKQFKLIEKVTPAKRMDGRRALWRNEAEAIEYFRKKKLMQRFDERCLADYVHSGTEPCEEGIKLRFNPMIEKEIYLTIPDNNLLTKPLKMPSAAIAGKHSKVFSAYQGARMQKRLGMDVRWLPGSHMFPLEHPLETAQTVHELLQNMKLPS